jgi:hypothetical protein
VLRVVRSRPAQAPGFVVFYNPMQLNSWFVLIIITGLCFIGLTIILREAHRESKLRRRKASVRKWVQSETVVSVRSTSAGAQHG